MGWVRISDLTSGQLRLPKDAVLIPQGMKPPENYRFCYITEIPSFNYVHGDKITDKSVDSSMASREELSLIREVWAPITGDE